MKLPIKPVFEFANLPKAGSKIQPPAPLAPLAPVQTPKPMSRSKQQQSPQQPAWLSDTPPAKAEGDIALATVEVLSGEWTHEQERAGGATVGPLEPISYHDGSNQALAAGYDDETKDQALNLIIDEGRSIISVCREMHLDRRTVGSWLNEYKTERETQSEANDLRQVDKLESVSNQILNSLDKNKLAKAGVKDLGIAYGILRDKLKDIRGPRSSGNSTTLRVAWSGGEGAIEVKQG